MPSTAPSAEAAADGAVDDPDDTRRSGRRVRPDRSFPRETRLLDGRAYDAVFADNRRVADRLWTVLAHRAANVRAVSDDRSGDDGVDERRGAPVRAGAKLGLAIAKKRARRAVDRNRIKRVARESFRHARASLDGYHVVVMNRDAAASASNVELRASLDALWRRLRPAPTGHAERRGDGRSSSGRRRGGRVGEAGGSLAAERAGRESSSRGGARGAEVDGSR